MPSDRVRNDGLSGRLPRVRARDLPGVSRGTVECPGYGAPAATAVPGPSMASFVPLGPPQAVTLFNGATPPNGFTVQVYVNSTNVPPYGLPNATLCFINDNGIANDGTGFFIRPDPDGYTATFITPVGYKPMGPVSVWCGLRNASSGTLTARGW